MQGKEATWKEDIRFGVAEDALPRARLPSPPFFLM